MAERRGARTAQRRGVVFADRALVTARW